ncbi:MFS transporter [Weizmannia acidilactici]|uniref:MFS-type drug efflux transporter P55 n=1 Tax=Weizmannia acidilactici TaxID=2607726 RepID=A0A5J4JFL4_9BACI|nr:MFS transporter [Weizmannia acidilactici]GER65558.1 MFS transporter [Weizmannia acidilactici]GER70431.1 MFS transporter [Weizmannia acidilactici]GER74098.1 MFS transporter [Weizmannia acidilactici]
MSNRTSVMISIVLAMLVSSIDSTIMNTTMPVIAKELGRFDLYAWAFASYMITSTILSPIAGRLSDLFGRKKVFGFGILLFLVGSLMCGLATEMIELIVFRAIQGIGAGFMVPFPAIIAGDLFSVENRGKIQALFTGMWGLSAVLAPLLGSFFVTYFTWRWIFFVNLPVCLISFLTLLPYQEHYEPKKASVDYIGAVLFAVSITLLLLDTVVHRNQILYAVIGVVFLIVFYFYEKRQGSPIVPLSMFKNKTIARINVNSFIGTVALFGASSYIPLFLQKVTGLSLLMSGVALLGSSIGWMAAAVPAGKWILKYGYRILFMIGNLLLLISGLLWIFLNPSHGFYYVFLVMIVHGAAFGLISTVGIIGSQQMVSGHEKGISTSFFMFTRNMGTAIGVTVMGAFLTSGATYMQGIHHLFLFGFCGSILALLTSFFIQNDRAEREVNAADS